MKKKIGLFLTSIVGALSLTSCSIEFSTSEYSGGMDSFHGVIYAYF